ncbi:MAG: glycosyltransferase family 4 protein [Candidatus Mcinerneyibacterium aminivorans]|uniref:Glycosyltransferase family 4 protein n=1 Tax=Candidatus Mcinerneyibacterium aminivorans TaxID=2703815 RepID=A0A5D0MEN1_9BACT|nr:MAG: glycosyltransferase family 4 protein [Candidatus Mcinerneyibacterium aminivorans]
MKLNIGFVGTRFAGLDGVSLEAKKWDDVLQKLGHKTFWFAGKLDTPSEKSYICEKAFFKDPEIKEINNELKNKKTRKPSVTKKIMDIKQLLKVRLNIFLDKFDIDLMIVENALSIPMNVPLGLAITEVIAERGVPTIGHHHDFAWERNRYLLNAFEDYLSMAFPPNLPFIEHVVINSIAQQQLAARRGLSSTLLPNVINFEREQQLEKDKKENFKKDFGFANSDIIFLQPTRIVARKGIEHSIDLVRRLENDNIKLVITHSSSDEGLDYYNWIIDYAKREGIDVYYINNKLHQPDKYRESWERIYTLWDVYPFADFVTYPSSFEGFGNAFLEAVMFKKPLLVNRYSIYIKDIEPKGFKTVTMDDYLSDKNIEEVEKVLKNDEYREDMVKTNYKIAKRYFSYDVLEFNLKKLIKTIFG